MHNTFFYMLKVGKNKKTTFQIIIYRDTIELQRKGRENQKDFTRKSELEVKNGIGFGEVEKSKSF